MIVVHGAVCSGTGGFGAYVVGTITLDDGFGADVGSGLGLDSCGVYAGGDGPGVTVDGQAVMMAGLEGT